MEKRVFVKCEDHDIPMMITYPENGENKFPAILLLHGYLAFKEGDGYMLRIGADKLAKNGIATARIDFCSMGENRYSRKNYGLKVLLKEAACAFDYLCADEMIDETRVGILGHSLGGRVTFLSSKLPSKCLVSLNGAINTMEDLPIAKSWDMEFLNEHGYIITPTSDGRTELVFKRFLDELQEVKSDEVLNYTNPICVVVGKCDPTLDPSISYNFVKNCHMDNVDMIEIDEANHTFNAKTTDNSRLLEMYDKLNVWLDSHLK